MRRRAELYLIDRLRGHTWKSIAAKYGVRLDTVKRTMLNTRRQWHVDSEQELVGLWLIFKIIRLNEIYD